MTPQPDAGRQQPEPDGTDARVHQDAMAFAVAAAGVGVWELDVVTGQEWWSDQTLALYGLPAGSVAPTRPQWRERFLYPEDRPRVERRAAHFQATGQPYEMDYRIRRADGAVRWLHTRAAFAFGGNRRVLGLTLDITERRAAEERAQESARLLDHAASQVGFGFGYREPGGDEGHWSPQLKRLYGLQPHDPTPGRSRLLELVTPADRDRVARELASPIGPGDLREFEFRVVRPDDGQERLLTTRAVTEYDAEGRPRRTYFALVDSTGRHQQEARMAELLLRQQMATEGSGVGIWEFDFGTRRNVWDGVMRALFDLPPGAEGLGRDAFLQRVHADDRARVAQALHAADNEHAALDIEYRIAAADGSVRWLRSRGRVDFGADGLPRRSIGVVFDTTRQREAEAALQARALAESANAAKTEFLSRMSHELRTPLNAVLGFAQLMALDSADPLSPGQRERIAHIQSAGWHLLALVNDVLDVARIESRQAQLVYSRVSLADVVQECLAMSEPLARSRDVALHWHQAPSDPAVLWADRTRFKQLLLNLISNAVKYNVPGGRVDISAAQPGTEVVVSVRDSGMGLTAEQRQRLFEPFNRLGREGTGIEGTGIGLALSKLLSEQMGGRITVDSEPGRGSCFSVHLPPAANL
jgi:signal transduction histidine kinase